MFGSAASDGAVALHLLERVERGEQPGAVVRAERRDVELGEAVGRLARA